MTDSIFARLGISEDASAETVAEKIFLFHHEDCQFDGNCDSCLYAHKGGGGCVIGAVAGILTAIERRGYRRMWEAMNKLCGYNRGLTCIYRGVEVGEWCTCQFDTCPLLKEGA